ncbi:hypothetical protein DPMN_081246 [Dreissena polymorpha]|uniref:Uncharacterized protein n=1 Tax=Dreissena polymorpha TaxID=45954 RepID=A0A9D3Y4Q5_DREPO|nr:hypothetical protein DPMN_081246 [Dreissena polymorpha]
MSERLSHVPKYSEVFRTVLEDMLASGEFTDSTVLVRVLSRTDEVRGDQDDDVKGNQSTF